MPDRGEENVFGPSKAPVDDTRTARIIEREEQVEILKDPFGQEVTRKFIRSRIMEVESARVGAHEDLAALPDDQTVEGLLAERGNQQNATGSATSS